MDAEYGRAAKCPLRKDDLMKPDLISEVVLAGSGLILLLPVLALVVKLLMIITGHH